MATDVSAPLPEVNLQPGHTITVTLNDASAVITELNVFAINRATGEVETINVIPPLFSYGPNE